MPPRVGARPLAFRMGGELARALFAADLVDDVGLDVHPVLLSAGVPLFRDAGRPVALDLTRMRPMAGGCVLLAYAVRRSASVIERGAVTSPVSPTSVPVEVLDPSNGFDAVAPAYIVGRGRDPAGVGAAVVRAWAAELARGAAVLDLGCGPGVPITQVLVDAGLRVWAVDASPRMLAAFRERFPDLPTECARAEDSRLFDPPFHGAFDAVVAWGLLFLLDEAAQALVLGKVARALARRGRFLFTAPAQACTWRDAQTGRPSRSLGAARYAALLAEGGLALAGTATDEGENHYYFAQKP